MSLTRKLGFLSRRNPLNGSGGSLVGPDWFIPDWNRFDS